MTFLLLLPAILSFLMLAAHWLRVDNPGLAGVTLALAVLLLVPRWWVVRIAQVVLGLAFVIWLLTIWGIIQDRMEEGKPWQRAALILLGVASLNLVAMALLGTRRLRNRYFRQISADPPVDRQ